jgi:hypothetical protein
MNAVEIEEAVSKLAEAPFDAATFPYAFLEAFGNKAATVKRLKSGNTNKSDLGGVLQQRNIHIKVCSKGEVTSTLAALRGSEATSRHKAKFILATDGQTFEAENLVDGSTVAGDYAKLGDKFGFFLPLAGITTVKQISENAFDIKATGRLNRLYVELLKENPDWDTEARRQDLNHFFARLIFCYFAEDTNIFNGDGLFTATIDQMSAKDGSDLHVVLAELFRAMDTPHDNREAAKIRSWAGQFPYVNGGLFNGNMDSPRFNRAARSYLLHVGRLDWKLINPDIFGSMIQAVAEDEERGALGLHYTSVPNILKVLNPLFLDDLRTHLDEAGDGKSPGSLRKLLNLRNRLARIRVFDPACGSGNFLVIAYKEMREIEAEINKRRGDSDRPSEIPLTNFRGIELRHFPAEIARLALIIAEYQCDVLYRGQKLALADFLPLEAANWIVCGNALRLDWLKICPPSGTGVKIHADDLYSTPLEQTEIDFENVGGETFICGNPPYKGRNRKGTQERKETEESFAAYPGSYASLDYVANWIIKAVEYCNSTSAAAGLVATNSVCQGEQVALLWPLVFKQGICISFAHTSFKWSNLASEKAGVTVVVIGLARQHVGKRPLYAGDEVRHVDLIGPYLVPNSDVIVAKRETPISNVGKMYLGNMAKDGGNLIMSFEEGRELIEKRGVDASLIRKFFGSEELIHSQPRYCLWIEDDKLKAALANDAVRELIEKVRQFRSTSKATSTREFASVPHRFVQLSAANGERVTIVPRVSSEARPYLPVDYFSSGPIIGDKCYAFYDEPLWNFALVASRLHIIWIGVVCSRLEMRFSYGNKLGWNTFPVPPLTDQNKADLTRCAEDILLAREAHFPATIADLYDPEKMPENLRQAHDRNDETLERIYIGRRFKNDTERLEKLFEMYTQMTAKQSDAKQPKRKTKKPKA